MAKATVADTTPKNVFDIIKAFISKEGVVVNMSNPIANTYKFTAAAVKHSENGPPHQTIFLTFTVEYNRHANHEDETGKVIQLEIESLPTGPYVQGFTRRMEYTANYAELQNTDGHYQFMSFIRPLIEKKLKPTVPLNTIQNLLDF